VHTTQHRGYTGVTPARRTGFRLLLAAQFAADTAQYAILFAATVVLEERTHSSTGIAWMILSSTLPGALFGPIAGLVVDRRDRVGVLVAANALRWVAALGFVLAQGQGNLRALLLAVYAACFTLSAAAQFISPAQGALTPDVAGRGSALLKANSLVYLLSLATQVLGVVVLAPSLLKRAGAGAVGVLGALLYLAATVLCLRLRRELPAQALQGRALSDVWADLRAGWSLILRDRSLSWTTLQLTGMAFAGLTLITLAPGMAARVLGAHVADVAYLALPAGLGFGLGLLLLGRRSQWLERAVWMRVGLFGFGLGLAILGLGAGRTGWGLALLALSGLAIGLGFALVNVTGRAALQERPPPNMRGRVLASQATLANLVTSLPLPLVGALADRVGIRSVYLVLAVPVLGVAGWERFSVWARMG